jgi:glycosyltransferase involved in cell wall biosynthesis
VGKRRTGHASFASLFLKLQGRRRLIATGSGGSSLRIAMLAPISWRTPPRHYGPWELMTSLLTEALLERGVDVTLFATADSLTSGKLSAVCPAPYSEDPAIDAKVWEMLHVASLFEKADEFDLIHNQADFVPLAFSRLTKVPMVVTIHGFSSERIMPIYEAYQDRVHYVAISNSDRRPELRYAATIHHGIRLEDFPFNPHGGDDLLFFGRIHPDKGTAEAIDAARGAGRRLVAAGIIQDQAYYQEHVVPAVDRGDVVYKGSLGGQDRMTALGSARALLHLVNFDEPFGLSVVEALACGTPVIAFNRGSMPELIDHGVTGFLVDSQEAAVDAIGRVGDLDRHACRAAVAERFNVNRMADNYLDLYRKVLSR